MKDLRSDEVADLFLTAQRVAEVVERAYGGEGCTVSCQYVPPLYFLQTSPTLLAVRGLTRAPWGFGGGRDGAAAGQSVPHVHIHILPRRFTDFEGENDAVYPALEAFSSDLPKNLASDNGTTSGERRERVALKMDADEDRKPRSAEEMEKEAVWLSGFF